MARKAFAVTEAIRKKVHDLAGFGVPQEDIAKMIGCSAKTLRKHFRNDLDLGEIEANAIVAGCLFKAATVDGNVGAMKFWLRTRAGWSEKDPIEDTRPIVNTVILPDNGRDPDITGIKLKLPDNDPDPDIRGKPKLELVKNEI